MKHGNTPIICFVAMVMNEKEEATENYEMTLLLHQSYIEH